MRSFTAGREARPRALRSPSGSPWKGKERSRRGVGRGRRRGETDTEGLGARTKGPQAAELETVPGGRRAARGLVSHLAERTEHPHIRGGIPGMERWLPKHRGAEVQKPPPPPPPPKAETHSARARSGLDPVAPKDLAFSKVSEGSPRPQAPSRGSTPGKGRGERGRKARSPLAQWPGTGQYWRGLRQGEGRRRQCVPGKEGRKRGW